MQSLSASRVFAVIVVVASGAAGCNAPPEANPSIASSVTIELVANPCVFVALTELQARVERGEDRGVLPAFADWAQDQGLTQAESSSDRPRFQLTQGEALQAEVSYRLSSEPSGVVLALFHRSSNTSDRLVTNFEYFARALGNLYDVSACSDADGVEIPTLRI